VRAFACDHCRSLIFFANTICIACGSAQGFDRQSGRLVVLDSDDGGRFFRDGSGRLWRPCANLALAECNWLAADSAIAGLCSCCALTRTRPADADGPGLVAFARTEAAKRRLLFQLDTLGLAITSRRQDPEHGLAFDLLSSSHERVTTGHDRGVITIDLAEGDDSHRERMRVSLDEPYRTLLGHLRHEIGHWYWYRMIGDQPARDAFHRLFGDEQTDYGRALAEHYRGQPAAGWQDRFVSAYATAHPWEDWAETFAHYLHICDTLQTAAAYGVSVAGPTLPLRNAASLQARPADPMPNFDALVQTWVPLTYALNAVNRSMGREDLYPFTLAQPVIDKLRFVHAHVVAAGAR